MLHLNIYKPSHYVTAIKSGINRKILIKLFQVELPVWFIEYIDMHKQITFCQRLLLKISLFISMFTNT